jgi:hypothetical protein
LYVHKKNEPLYGIISRPAEAAEDPASKKEQILFILLLLESSLARVKYEQICYSQQQI